MIFEIVNVLFVVVFWSSSVTKLNAQIDENGVLNVEVRDMSNPANKDQGALRGLY